MNIHYTVELAKEEREILRALICGGSPRARKVKRALILLLADQGDTQEEIARSVDVGTSSKTEAIRQRGIAAGGHCLLGSSDGTGALDDRAIGR